jgi:transcriptional regulator with XRE-family HTH domain
MKYFSKTNLRLWREYRGHSQEFLSDLVGRTKGTVWRWENRLSGLSQEMLDKLAEVLNTSRSNILDGLPPKIERENSNETGDRSRTSATARVD